MKHLALEYLAIKKGKQSECQGISGSASIHMCHPPGYKRTKNFATVMVSMMVTVLSQGERVTEINPEGCFSPILL